MNGLISFCILLVGLLITAISLVVIVIKLLLRIVSKKKLHVRKELIFFTNGLILLLTGGYYSFFDMQHLPIGELIKEVPSPNGDYTFKAYLTNGGATVDFAIRGEVVFKKQGNRDQTIYWNYHEDHADMKWMDNQTLNINGHILNVEKDQFDFRRH